MSQPPAGGFPPPDQQPSGAQPPAGPPAQGAQQPPAGGYPPPAQQPAPPPAQPQAGAYPPPQGGYPPPPPAGQPGYPPPPQGGYPPAGQQGYPPPPQQGGYPPPPQGGYPGAPGPSTSSIDFSKVSILGWCVMGAAFLTLIASFFNFWSISATGLGIGYGYGYNGWSLWWWIPVLIALAVGVVYALTIFGVLKPGQVQPIWLLYAAAASFVLMIFVLIHTFFYGGIGSGLGVSAGPGFGVWFALVTTLALTYFTALYAQSAGAKLPFKIPGPANF